MREAKNIDELTAALEKKTAAETAERFHSAPDGEAVKRSAAPRDEHATAVQSSLMYVFTCILSWSSIGISG
jgi:hypothetical protein